VTRKTGKQRSPRRWPWVLAGAAFLATTVAAGLAYATSAGHIELLPLRERLRGPLLQLRRVEFIGLDRLDASGLWRRAQVASDAALIDIDTESIAARIVAHPRVERCEVLRVPPGLLLIEVRERVPVAIETETGAGVDVNGERFPLLAGESEHLPGVEGSILAALPLLRAARELGVRIRTVRSRGTRDLRFRPWAEGFDVRVGADARGALRNWLRLSESGLIDVYGPREVDLRFAGSAVLRNLRRNQGGEDGTP
jgi:cell division septal protein FtsQ